MRYIDDFSSVDLDIGGKLLRHTQTDSGRRAFSWDTPGEHTDVEAVAVVSLQDPDERIGIIVRGAGSGGNETGLVAQLKEDRDLEVVSYDDGSFTSYQQVGPTPDQFWRYVIRFRVEGSSVKAKAWLYDEDEPSSWQYDDTISDVSGSGWIGMFSFDGDGGRKNCLYFSVDTNGGSAPLPYEGVESGQYATDFTEYDVGEAPDDWTERWNTSSSTLEITDQPFSVVAAEVDGWEPDWDLDNISNGWAGDFTFGTETGYNIGGRTQESGRRLVRFTDVGTVTDVEIYARFRNFHSSAPTTRSFGRVYARGSGDESNANVYWAECYKDSARVSLRVRKYVDGSVTTLGLYEFSTQTWGYGVYLYWEWISIRFRLDGDRLRAKIWFDDYRSPQHREPDWLIDTNDSDHSSGWVGIGGFSEADYRFDRVGVGTDGDEAPGSHFSAPRDLAVVFNEPNVELSWKQDWAKHFKIARQRWVGSGSPP